MPRSIVLMLLGGVLVALVVAPAPPASGGPEQTYFLGEPWEAGIERGVEAQRQAEHRRVPPATVLGRAERAARRDPSVVKLYLLARAYGLSALWHRMQWATAQDEAGRAGHAAAASRDHAAAVATYRDVLAKAPRCYFAYHDMGILELRSEKPDVRAAFDHFSRAYRINGRYTDTQRQLVKLYLEGRQHAEAVPLLQRILQLEPEDEEARGRLVTVLAEQKQYDAAYRELATLRKAQPANEQYMAMEAHLDSKTARYARAIDTYKKLARANPNVPAAYYGILDCVKGMEAQQMPVDLEDVLLALKGLLRLVRAAEERQKIAEQIKRVEHALAEPQGGAPCEPPTTAQLLHALTSPDAQMRVTALIQLMLREEPATREVLRAVASKIDPAAEPEAAVRAGAVRCLGRLSGTALVPLIRIGLRDPDARVRVETADTLVAVGRRDPGAAGGIIAILGPYVQDQATGLSSSARQGILQLASATLTTVDEKSDDAAHREAFRRWWSGAAGESVQIDALDGYHRLKDRAAHEVIVPYLHAAGSYHVFRAAYEALIRSEPHAGTDVLRGWHAAMPRFPQERWCKANWQALRQSLDRWIAAQPGR